MSQDQLPIKIVVIPPSAAQVSRAMADIEAKVKSSGRRIGQAMAVKPGGKEGDAAVRAYYAKLKRLDDIRLVGLNNNIKSARASFMRAENEKLAVKKATTSKLRAMQERDGLEVLRIGKAQTRAFAENERRKTTIAKIEAKRRQAEVARGLAINRARSRVSSGPAGGGAEAIFQAAGIKSPARRVAEIKNVRRAQAELNSELSRGVITRLQYNTMLKATRNKLNLLERGDVRARGALQRFTAKLASATFEITGAVFGLTALGLALSSPAIAGTKYLAQLEDVKLGISGILLAMGSMNGEMLTFKQASAAADEQIKALANDAISLAGTLEDFTKSFQAILAPGLAAGMTLTEIRKIAVAGTIAVKTIGLDSRQIVQEIRDLVAGGIQAASSTLATSLGLTDRDIKKAKLSSEGLFKFLSAKLDGFYQAGLRRSETLTGKIEQTYEIFIRGLAEASEPVLETLKGLFDDISDRIATIDKKTNELTFKPEFINGVKAFVSGINTALEILLKVVKVAWEFKNVILATIALKAGRALWAVLTTAATSYAAALRGVMVSEVALEVIQSARTSRAATGLAAAAGAKKFGGGAFSAEAGNVGGAAAATSIFSGEAVSKLMSKLKANVLRIAKFGAYGIIAYGIYKIGSKLFDVFNKDVAKLASTAGETAAELRTRLAKEAEATATVIGASVQKIKTSIASLEDEANTGRNSAVLKILRENLARVEAQYESARDKANKFGDAALTLSERIKRMGAAVTAAKKAIEAIGGAFLKGAQDAEKQIQGITALADIQQEYVEFLERSEKLGSSGSKGFKEQNSIFKEQIELLKEGSMWNEKIFNAQVAVNSAVKGSKAAIIAKGHSERVSQLATLIGHQKTLTKQLMVTEEALAISRKKFEKRPELEKQIEQLKRRIDLNKQQQVQTDAIRPEDEAQKKFNASIKQGAERTYEFIKSIEARTAAQKAEVSSRKKSGIEEATVIMEEKFRKAQQAVFSLTDKDLQKAFVQGPGGEAERLQILERERMLIEALATAYGIALPAAEEFFKADNAKKWAAQVDSANNITRKYLKTIQDKIDLNDAELRYIGLSGLEISILKARQKEQTQLNRLKEKYTRLANKENTLANALALTEETNKINAATERLVESMRRRNEEERKFTTGAETFFKQYVTDAGNIAAITTNYFSGVMGSLTSDLSNYFKTGENDFNSFKNAVSQGLADIAAQMVTAGLVESGIGVLTAVFGGPNIPAVNTTAGGVAAGGSFAPSTIDFGNARGNAFDPSGLVAFAKGGIVSTPTTFPFAKGTGLMGEAGPEAIMPLSRTTSGDLGVKVSGGQGGTVNQINVEVNVNSEGSSETNAVGDGIDGKAIGNALGNAVQAEILKQMRPGGLLTQR